MVRSVVDLRTTQGELLRMTLPMRSPTAADVIRVLRGEPYFFAPTVVLMYDGRPLEDWWEVFAFPPGSVVVAGHRLVGRTQSQPPVQRREPLRRDPMAVLSHQPPSLVLPSDSYPQTESYQMPCNIRMQQLDPRSPKVFPQGCWADTLTNFPIPTAGMKRARSAENKNHLHGRGWEPTGRVAASPESDQGPVLRARHSAKEVCCASKAVAQEVQDRQTVGKTFPSSSGPEPSPSPSAIPIAVHRGGLSSNQPNNTRALSLPAPPKPIDCWLTPSSSPTLVNTAQQPFTPEAEKELEREPSSPTNVKSPATNVKLSCPSASGGLQQSEDSNGCAPQSKETSEGSRSECPPTRDADQSCSAGPIKPRGSQLLTLTVQIPPDEPPIHITVPDNATVADAVHACSELNPALKDCGLIFRGKVLTDRPREELKSFGIHDGMTLHAVMRSVDPIVVHLAEVKADLHNLKAPFLDEAGSVRKLDSRRTHAFYEDSMKLLYRLDNLEGLPDDLRAERKALVKEIQQLQDTLHEQS